MRCVYHPDYFVALPPSHPFPMAKYPLLFERLRREGLLDPDEVIEPGEADLAEHHQIGRERPAEQGTGQRQAHRQVGPGLGQAHPADR